MADILAILASLPYEVKYNLPVIQPPAGMQTNFNSTESRGPTTLAVASVLFVLMTIAFSIRIYVRFWITRQASWGDVSCIVAALGATAYFLNLVIAIRTSPLGRHLYNVRLTEVDDRFIITTAYLAVVLTLPVLLAAKLTLFALYYEIFHPFKWMRICVYLGVVLTILFHVGAGVAQFVLCTPGRGETWQSHVYSKAEAASQDNAVPFSSIGLIIDVYLLVLPIKALSDLQLPTARKIAIGVVFLTGILACIASSLNIWLRQSYARSADATWLAPYVILCTLIEMNIGVIVACMPAISKLFNQALPRLKALQMSFRASQFRNGRGNSAGYSSKRATDEQVTPAESQTEPNSNTSPFREYRKMKSGPELPYELNHLPSVSTDIRTSIPSRGDISEDRIHLKREVWQA